MAESNSMGESQGQIYLGGESEVIVEGVIENAFPNLCSNQGPQNPVRGKFTEKQADNARPTAMFMGDNEFQ